MRIRHRAGLFSVDVLPDLDDQVRAPSRVPALVHTPLGRRSRSDCQRPKAWSKLDVGTMIELVDEKRAELAELCRRYGVDRLYLFGSVATERFVPTSSDLDFVVELSDRQPADSYADRYFGLLEALEGLFGCPVDLVVDSAIRNPYFRDAVEKTKALLYAA